MVKIYAFGNFEGAIIVPFGYWERRDGVWWKNARGFQLTSKKGVLSKQLKMSERLDTREKCMIL